MNDLLIVIIPALIALVGTLITLYVTRRQQDTQIKQEINKPFTADQQTAYKALWENLEQVHIQLRTGDTTLDTYNHAVQQVNAFMMKNALYLDDGDQANANLYLAHLRRLAEIVNKYSDQIPQLLHGWNTTAKMDMSAIQQFQVEEQKVVEESEKVRQQILEKCRSVLKGVI